MGCEEIGEEIKLLATVSSPPEEKQYRQGGDFRPRARAAIDLALGDQANDVFARVGHTLVDKGREIVPHFLVDGITFANAAQAYSDFRPGEEERAVREWEV